MNTFMKHLPPLFALAAFTLMTCVVGLAQPTWTLEETVLNEYTLVSGVNIPWELTWGPDDMLWCTTREGDVLRSTLLPEHTTPCSNST